MQPLEVSGAVRPLYVSLGVRGLIDISPLRCLSQLVILDVITFPISNNGKAYELEDY